MKAFNLPPAADGNFLERRSGLSNLSREAARPKCVSRVTERLKWFGDWVRGGNRLRLINKQIKIFLKEN